MLAWGDAHRRDLPWRRARDPWAVLVSELMLQQTQVARVVPRFARFLDRFPTVAACASSRVADVVEEWAGLGYNRRAVDLHRAAVAVVDRHGGAVPRDLAALVALPGVGQYTARAVLTFAFGDDVGVVEVNTARVLARAFAGRRLERSEAQALADGLVPAGAGWAWNQAMIDIGATLCGKSATNCSGCPLLPSCAWAAAGHASPDPAIGSAGEGTRQSAFAGSDRQGRGRLVDALRQGPVAPADVAAAAGWPGDVARARRIATGIVADGLAVLDEATGALRLP